jgi:RNA polymerase sigma-70 factor, ECF subfamily
MARNKRPWQERFVTGLCWFVAVQLLVFGALKFSPVGFFGYSYPEVCHVGLSAPVLVPHWTAQDLCQRDVSRPGADGIENLRGWLTTIVARVYLNALQARKARPEDAAGVHVPDPIVRRVGALDPDHEVLMADSVGLALQIVLDTLSPAERLAFVLHDMFDVPFDEIGPMVGRSATAARQLASRARRRVQGASVPPDPDLVRQREVVDAFFAAAHRGDFEALVAVLDPDVILRADGRERRGAPSFVRRGAPELARTAITSAQPAAAKIPALINGAAGVVVMTNGRPFVLIGLP